MIISYDGTDYSGWQSQLNSSSVQDTIQDAIEVITKVRVNVIGSGRTDAGVHSLGQTANFRIEQELDLYRFKFQLNSVLPKDIAITFMEKTSFDFHARFDARKRSYLYLITNTKSPFWFRYSGQYYGPIDCVELNKLSQSLIGERDYTSFSRRQTDTENKICNIYNVHWRRTKELIIFYIEASRYLHGMVRTIAGTLLDLHKRKLGEEHLLNIIEQKNRELSGEALPAKGLFLYKVKY